MQTITLKSEENGKRIDAYVSSNTDITRSRAASLLEEGNITVNGVVPLKSYKLKIGDEICVNIPEPVELNVIAQDIPLDIVYEDEH